jgi:hypothetical protein
MPFGGGKTTSLPISSITGISTATLSPAKVVTPLLEVDDVSEKTASHSIVLGSDLTPQAIVGLNFPQTINHNTGAADLIVLQQAGNIRGGQKKTLTLHDSEVMILDKITFYIKKEAGATGTIACKVRNAADSVLDTATESVDISTLAETYAAYEFNFPGAVELLNGTYRILIEGVVGGGAGKAVYARGQYSAYTVEQKTTYDAAYTDTAGASFDTIQEWQILFKIPA